MCNPTENHTIAENPEQRKKWLRKLGTSVHEEHTVQRENDHIQTEQYNV